MLSNWGRGKVSLQMIEQKEIGVSSAEPDSDKQNLGGKPDTVVLGSTGHQEFGCLKKNVLAMGMHGCVPFSCRHRRMQRTRTRVPHSPSGGSTSRPTGTCTCRNKLYAGDSHAWVNPGESRGGSTQGWIQSRPVSKSRRHLGVDPGDVQGQDPISGWAFRDTQWQI